jgi:hypothetical protein
LGKTSEEREALFKLVKQFYSIRSKLVHGGKANKYDMYNIIPQAFHLCAKILKSILVSYTIAEKFCSESKRKDMFREWLFDV